LIKGREALLHSLLRISPTAVFNPDPCPTPPEDNAQIAVELKMAVNKLKELAISSDGSRVDYHKIQQSSAFAAFTERSLPKLHHYDLNSFNSWHQAAGFWINLYNVLVIHAVILGEYGASITENGYAGMIRFFRGAAYQVGGYRFSLEDIEHGILRSNAGNPFQYSSQFPSDDPRMDYVLPLDPRIHFALNCASRSCPPIGVYSVDQLESQLDQASTNFISQETRINGSKLDVSTLFKWYQADFGGREGVVQFIKRYLPDDSLVTGNNSKSLRIVYSKYDWGLNI
jgi:hypothetical protein